MKKRIIAVLLAGALLLGTTACGGKDTSSGSKSPDTGESKTSATDSANDGATGDTGPLNAPGELPIVKEGEEVTLSLFMPGTNNIVTSFDYDDNLFTKQVMDETGLKLEFVTATAADLKEKQNMLLNTGDYPDIMLGSWALSYSDVDYYGKQGIFIPVNELNLDAYPKIQQIFDEYPATKETFTSNDGNMYALPSVNDCYHCVYSGGRAFYYAPFLRDSGKELPKTTEEFKEYLTYLRDGDPNGNGQNDEVPLAFNSESTTNFISTIAKWFLPWVDSDDGTPGIAMADGKITEQYKSDEFKQALKYMKELYDEDLILKESFTMSTDELLSIGENPGDPVLGMQFCTWSNTAFTKGSDRWHQNMVLPPMEGPNGHGYSGNKSPRSVVATGMCITDKCENPEAALALYNYFLNPEVALNGYLGPKGTGWDEPDANTLSLQGEAPLYKVLQTYMTSPVNTTWDQHHLMFRNSDFRLGEQAKDYETVKEFLDTFDSSLLEAVTSNDSFNEIFNFYTTDKNSAPYALSEDMFLPLILMDDADNTRVTDIKAVLIDYEKQTWVEFITGVRDIDAEWDTYLQELDNMGSAEMVEIMQKYV